ncbi:DUF58 domain-containing protein [Microbacterium gorillae]|uniref:DUF58 domain-containing protein n=1 Tax=Microbacterium gorillae TaxID=1231063 RepID=UPI0006940C21|nr:DUF58 domain-containing protein [Microbacterium gorillae]
MSTPRPRALTAGPAALGAALTGLVLGGAGLVSGRADVVACGLAPLIWAIVVWGRRARPADTSVTTGTLAPQGTRAVGEVRVNSGGELVEAVLEQGPRRTRTVIVPATAGVIGVASDVAHSGPTTLVSAVARTVDADGALTGPASPRTDVTWYAVPGTARLTALPPAPRLTGLNGAHEGTRIGHGGDFRDINPFAPGDELRRVDWRATARLARRPGELFVRRTHALSDASTVIVIDTADDLGAVVASWGSGDSEASGVTSLDLAREAARAIAEATIAAGDRVALHELALRGRSIRSGGGARQLAHVLTALSAIGPRADDERYRRTPPVPAGSVIYILSTFFDGDASRLALTWAAGGHRIVAVDTLPKPDLARLTRQQDLAARLLFAEQRAILADLDRAGAAVVQWAAGADDLRTRLGAMARERR